MPWERALLVDSARESHDPGEFVADWEDDSVAPSVVECVLPLLFDGDASLDEEFPRESPFQRPTVGGVHGVGGVSDAVLLDCFGGDSS